MVGEDSGSFVSGSSQASKSGRGAKNEAHANTGKAFKHPGYGCFGPHHYI
jgi:hypothetical protein